VPHWCAGRGSVWLERLLWEQEVDSSSLSAPTYLIMQVYVYILKSSKDGSFYVGLTKDIGKRIMQHNNGYNVSTEPKRPWVLVRAETYSSNLLAIKREKFLKTCKGRKVVKSICSR
jgi:putative endonuclease